ncbi:GNAT family N-acetyltransferase [Robertkochia aurantiaca]|uniref:GNAT family N-acetyltransferase n=1 Tax=Robertkochia aurantiaca TaxID=2873700 RepID=UPI0021031EDD|nr:GNAT family N-acetyltransferase [Robertkochia sp. 3YJGBD-33]
MSEEDWESVKAIYQSGIATGIATFETAAPDRVKFDLSHLKFGRLVATINNEIAGWAALSPVSGRAVYSGVAEVSIYIAEHHRGKGVGQLLLKELIAESEKNGIWTLQASVFTENTPSISLHKSVGFRVVGFRERIARRNGQWKDNFLLERRSNIVGQE